MYCALRCKFLATFVFIGTKSIFQKNCAFSIYRYIKHLASNGYPKAKILEFQYLANQYKILWAPIDYSYA